MRAPRPHYRVDAIKESEVGPIGADWWIAQLGEITEPERPISYGIVQTGPRIQNGIACLRVVDISDGKIHQDDLITTSVEISDSYRRTKLRTGDLVVPLRGKVGECAQVPPSLAGANLTRGVALLAVLPQHSAVYCKQYFSSGRSSARLNSSMNGSALQEIPISTLRAFKIALPATKLEQDAIADALTDVDALIDSLEQLLTKKRQIKQGAMQEFFKPARRTRRTLKLEQISSFITKGATPTTYGFGWESDGIAFLRSECVSARGLDLSQSMFISEAAHTSLSRSAVSVGDLLMTITGNVGRVVRASIACNINQHIARIRIVDPDVNADLVYHHLSRDEVRKELESITTGQAYPQLSLKQVREHAIHLPAREEQDAIARALSDMDKDIVALESRLTKARDLKQAMAQALLTGRIRLMEPQAA